MSDRASVLHRNSISHLVVHACQLPKQSRFHLDLLFVGQAELSKLHQTDTIPDDLLREVGPIERVDTIRADSSPLDLDSAQVSQARPIRLLCVVGEALAWEA